MFLKFLITIAFSIIIFFGLAFGLILSERPVVLSEQQGLDFSKPMANRFETPQSSAFLRKSFEARDGTQLNYTHVSAKGAEALPLVIMLHGSGWYGGQFDALAWALRDVAEVKALTLRGHGASPERRGDISYLGQFEDDIADLIGETDRKVILLGHSSGGGLAVRFAGGIYGAQLSGAILLAPFLKYDAPVTKQKSGGWAFPLTRRIIGLSMLNGVGVHALDGLTVIQFNMPAAVLNGPMGHYATTAYSWRLNSSFAPRNDYLADVAKLAKFLLVVGSDDEAFEAEGFAPLMSSVTDQGTYHVVDGVSHLDIVDHPRTEALIREYLSDL